MRKSFSKIAVLAALAFVPRLAFAAYPPVQDHGSVEYSTSVAITVSTTATILLSTGSNVFSDGGGVGPEAIIASSFTNTQVLGQFMPDRINITITNTSSRTVWIGYSANVATFPHVNMGFKINPSTTGWFVPAQDGVWSSNDSIKDYYIRSDDFIPTPQIVVRQSK